MIPLWAIYGLLSALCVVVMLLVQERMKAEGFALSFWVKFFVVTLTLPLAMRIGFPEKPVFYLMMAISAVLYCISDVAYFRAIPKVGSGLVTRVMPVAVVISFLLWLVIDPSLLRQYSMHPMQTFGIIASVLLAAISGIFLKRCPVSWQGIKLIGVCLFAACVGPTFNKLALHQAPSGQAVLSYIVIQGFFMLGFWSLYAIIRKPISYPVLFSPHNIKAGLIVGLFSTAMLILKMQAVYLADNPAYVSILMYTDALWIILIYKAIGRKETGNIWAGLGIVASAVLLIIFKSL